MYFWPHKDFEKTQEEKEFFERAHYCLMSFKGCHLGREGGRFRAYYETLRAVFNPEDDRFYHGGGIFDQENFRQHSPEPVHLVRKAVNLLLSYMMSPTDTYFKLSRQSFRTQDPLSLSDEEKNDKSADEEDIFHSHEVFLEGLTEDNHTVLQRPENFNVEALFTRDRVVFGHGCKVIEPDAYNVARAIHILPENIIMNSSTGTVIDITGYVKKKSDYSAYKTLGKPIFTKDEQSPQFEDFVHSLGKVNYGYYSSGYTSSDEATSDNARGKVYYRLNIPYPVLEDMILSNPDWGDLTRKKMEKICVKEFFKPINDITEKEESIVDVWFGDNAIYEPQGLRARNVIVAGFHLGASETSVSAGLGRECLGLFGALSEVFLMNLTGYERTNVPPYTFPEEAARYGIDLNMDGVIFTPSGEQPPSVLSTGVDINGLILFWNDLIRQLKEALGINDFEMTDKTHQIAEQVSVKSTEGYRTIASFVSVDQAQNLEPSVLRVNDLLYSKAGKGSKESFKNLILDIRYTSPVTFSQKNSRIEKLNIFLDLVTKYAAAKDQSQSVTLAISDKRFVVLTASSLGILGIFKPEKLYKIQEQIMQEREALKDEALINNAEQGRITNDSGEEGNGRTPNRPQQTQRTPGGGQTSAGGGRDPQAAAQTVRAVQ